MLRYLFLIILSVSFGISSPLADIDPWKESHRMEEAYQYDTAINVLKGISADNELVKLRRGWLNYLKGSHSEAIEHYKLAIKANQNSLDARLGIILPLLAQQRWHEAAQNANKVLEISPWNYYAHVRLMATEEALKKWQVLEKHADAVHQRYPSDATVLVYLGRAHLRLGNTQAAGKYYRKVLELTPDHFEAKQYAN